MIHVVSLNWILLIYLLNILVCLSLLLLWPTLLLNQGQIIPKKVSELSYQEHCRTKGNFLYRLFASFNIHICSVETAFS